MAKNKEEKTNVMRVLEQKKIAYTPHSYPHEEGMAVDGVTAVSYTHLDVYKRQFEHCVANMYYFTMGGAWSSRAVLYLLVMTVGNAAGGVIGPLARKVLSR